MTRVCNYGSRKLNSIVSSALNGRIIDLPVDFLKVEEDSYCGQNAALAAILYLINHYSDL